MAYGDGDVRRAGGQWFFIDVAVHAFGVIGNGGVPTPECRRRGRSCR